MNKKNMLHYLRNPYDVDKIVLRKARLQAADELERLYKIEKRITNYMEKTALKEYLSNKK